MPSCLFVLSRFTLRVDNVLFRTHDTRIYHSFSSEPPLVIRETCGWEAPYDIVKRVCVCPLHGSCTHRGICAPASSQKRRHDAAHGPNVHCEGPGRLALASITANWSRDRLAGDGQEGGGRRVESVDRPNTIQAWIRGTAPVQSVPDNMNRSSEPPGWGGKKDLDHQAVASSQNGPLTRPLTVTGFEKEDQGQPWQPDARGISKG